MQVREAIQRSVVIWPEGPRENSPGLRRTRRYPWFRITWNVPGTLKGCECYFPFFPASSAARSKFNANSFANISSSLNDGDQPYAAKTASSNFL